jgi:N-formylglutamate deformylase
MPAGIRVSESGVRPDFIVGDRFGASASAAVVETAISLLSAMGYTVAHNKPYAGGFITEHYGNPAAGLHAIQLEINRALYMDERRFERSPSFAGLAADLETLAERLGALPIEELRPYRAAAE